MLEDKTFKHTIAPATWQETLPHLSPLIDCQFRLNNSEYRVTYHETNDSSLKTCDPSLINQPMEKGHLWLKHVSMGN